MPGTANEMKATAGCRIVMGRSGIARPTADIMDVPEGGTPLVRQSTAHAAIHHVAFDSDDQISE